MRKLTLEERISRLERLVKAESRKRINESRFKSGMTLFELLATYAGIPRSDFSMYDIISVADMLERQSDVVYFIGKDLGISDKSTWRWLEEHSDDICSVSWNEPSGNGWPVMVVTCAGKSFKLDVVE